MMSPVESVLAGAALTEGIEEVPPGSNRGRAVELCQRATGNEPGAPWCASWVARVGATMLAERWPLPRTASCDRLLEFARAKNLLREAPLPGDVFLVLKSDADAVHTGLVTQVYGGGRDGFATIEGNTATDGGREGTGVYRRIRGTHADRARYAFVRWTAALTIAGVAA